MSNLRSPLEAWLAKPAEPAKGLHQDIFTLANFCLEENLSIQETFWVLTQASDGAHRFVPDREKWSAIEYARARILGEAAPGIVWPALDLGFRAETLKNFSADMRRLRMQVPPPIRALAYLHALYQDDDLVCIGKTASEFRTVRLRDIPYNNQDLGLCEFVNPSPMSAQAGLTVSGDWSEHAKSNTGPRKYAVIEFDSGELWEHASILKYLATRMPLTMIVYSGGMSLHGWFKAAQATEGMVLKFYEEAVMLGADPKMFSPCQFSRLPMGRHSQTGRTQRVIFFRK